MLEGEHHAELTGSRIGVGTRGFDVDQDHLADAEQLGGIDAHFPVQFAQVLVQPRPFHHQGRVVADPVQRRGAVGQRQGLGDQVDHVHAEAVDAALYPAPHHGVDRLTHRRVLPVQVGLLGCEQMQVVLAGRGVELPSATGEEGAPVGGLGSGRPWFEAGTRGSPEVPIPLVGVRIAGFGEPRVLVGGVVHDQIHDQLYAAGMQPGDQSVQVFEGAEERVDVVVVTDVVAVVCHRRAVDRREPDDVHSKRGEVVEMGDDARDVADPVPVTVCERPRVDLIDDRTLPPRSHGRHSAVLGDHLPGKQHLFASLGEGLLRVRHRGAPLLQPLAHHRQRL